MTWIPLVFLTWEGWRDRRTGSWVFLGIGAVSMQLLAGHVQYFFYTSILLGLSILLDFSRIRDKGKCIAGVIFFYLGAAGLTAVELLPAVSAGAETLRVQSASYQTAATYFFPWENLLTLVMPSFFGGSESIPYWGRGFFSESSLYVGIPAFWFFLFILFHQFNKNQKAIYLLAASLVLALGSQLPTYKIFFHCIPFFGSFRGTTKFDVFVLLFMALLAGMGLDQILDRKIKIKYSFLGSILLAGFLALGWGLYLFLWGAPESDRLLERIGQISFFGGFSLLVAFCFLAVSKAPRNYYFYPLGLMAFLGICDLTCFAASHCPSFNVHQYEGARTNIQEFCKRQPGDYRVLSSMGDGAMDLIPDVWGVDPMVLDRYGRFVAQSQGVPAASLIGEWHPIRKSNPLLGFLRFRYSFVGGADRLTVYETRLSEMPRIQLLDHYEVIRNSQDVLDRIASPDFNPMKKVILENAPDPIPNSSGFEGEARIADVNSDTLDIRVKLDHPSILVLGENYAKDWRVSAVEKGPQEHYEVLPADLAFRAVPLCAGSHHLKMEYRPEAFEIGMGISNFCIFVYGLAGLTLLHRKSSS